jgi:hypothetical protein
VPTQSNEIAVFDFLSLDHMHLAFNEGYIRVLRSAHPEDNISFHAVKGHVERLAPRVADLGDVILRPCPAFEPSFGFSHHNPIAGRRAARRCLEYMIQTTAGRSLRLVALLGVNASLFAVAGRRWPAISSAPLHLILHGQLGEAMMWRSRNPFLRAGDFIAQLKRPPPRSVSIVALELGIKEAISEIAPSIAPSILTLEHPILVSEWAKNPPLTRVGSIKIGFAGHARREKGFDVFAELARSCLRPDIEFLAIGHSSPETDQVDITKLSQKPAKTPICRKEYLSALAEVALVCLPFHSRAYDFTGSGTVSDAIAVLRPLIAIRNRTLEAIFRRYGPIGCLADNKETLGEVIRALDRTALARQYSGWIENLKMMRETRSPDALAKSYAASIGMIDLTAARVVSTRF